MRAEMRSLLEAPARITITETESMVIITTGEGRTLRLATDSKKVKDESTGIERKTHWEAGKLVTEISGAGPAKITETYVVDAETGRLSRTVVVDGRDNGRPPMHQVYDRES